MEYSTPSLWLKPTIIRSLVVILNANGKQLQIFLVELLVMVIAVPFCSHWLICTSLKTQSNNRLFVIIHHMVQYLVVIVIFLLTTHQTSVVVVMPISVILIKMMSTTLIISFNHGKNFQVVMLIYLVRHSMKYMEWYWNEIT
jgi:hypothetical protein